MDSFVKWIGKKIVNVITDNEESKKKCAEIEDAQKIRIDSSPLHCPVCLSVFFRSPEILHCGHTFCVNCIDAPPLKNTFECPLCRFNVPLNAKKTRNYALEAILDSLETYDAEDSELAANDSISAFQFINKRLKAEKQEQQKCIVELTNKLDDARKEGSLKVTLLIIGYTLLAAFLVKEVLNYVDL